MKKFVKDFALRGMIAAGFGPLILVSIYLGLQLSGIIISIPTSQVNLNIISSLILAFIAGGISAIFNVEKISLGVATLIDAIVIYLDYLIIYLINNWIKAQFIPLRAVHSSTHFYIRLYNWLFNYLGNYLPQS